MRRIKPEIRIVGFDDAPFTPRTKSKVTVIGVVYRGGNFLDGILKTEVSIDGMDATHAIADRINTTKHKEQLRVIMLNGITIGGFNLVDIEKLSKQTSLPVIVITRKMPDMEEFKRGLEKFKDFKQRWQCVENAGSLYYLKIQKNKSIYYQFTGLTRKEAEDIIRLSCTHSLIPEPLRVAHLIASALVKGESGGRA